MKRAASRGLRAANGEWLLANGEWLLAFGERLSATKKWVLNLLATILFRRGAEARANAISEPLTANGQPLAASSQQSSDVSPGPFPRRLAHRLWSALRLPSLKADSRPLNALSLNADSRWLKATTGLACLLFALLLGGAAVLGGATPAQCSGLCQGCYCDSIINGTCMVNGRPSACIGCVGSCINPGECQCRAGVGGCGAVIAWCRGSDCQPRDEPTATPTPAPTPTPPPPVCQERIYDFIQPPQVVDWVHRPDYPTVVGQDSTFRGFDLVIAAAGGYAETRQVALEQLCPDGSTDPAHCPADWRWQCTENVLVHYDDPLVAVDLPMRLADSSMAWLNGELPQRYYHASPKEGLPKTFYLWRGEAMSVQTGLFDYKAQDPGVHGGRILVTTKGTPLNPPQQISQPYEVKVHLLDTTLER